MKAVPNLFFLSAILIVLSGSNLDISFCQTLNSISQSSHTGLDSSTFLCDTLETIAQKNHQLTEIIPTGIEEQKIISNVFYETDLRQAIQDIAAQAEVTIITDNTVQGFITMEINDIPFELALRRILSVGGYTFKKLDGYYLAGAAEPSNPSFSLLSTTKSIPINYIPAEIACNLLSDFYKIYAKPNTISNSLIITASPEIIESIKNDLSNIDIPPRQVMIKAAIVEIKDDASKSLGIDWSLLGNNGNTKIAGNSRLSVGLLDTLNAIFSLVRSETGVLMKGTPIDIVTSLQALGTDGKAEVKANPNVVTTNAQPATIYIAKEQYFSVVTGPVNYPYTRLEQVSVGIKLEITPYISENDEITVKISPEVSDAAGYGREGLPLVDRRSVNTTIRVKDSQTIVIGGLTQQNIRKVQNKIPFLGSIPILGYLFSHTKYEKQKTNIIVFVTPKILREE